MDNDDYNGEYDNNENESDADFDVLSDDESEFHNDDLLLKISFLNIKPLTNLLSYLDKSCAGHVKFQFRKSKIECVNISFYEGREESVYTAVIPEWRIYKYKCRTEILSGYDEENPSAKSFVLSLNPQIFLNHLKNAKSARNVTLVYFFGGEHISFYKNGLKETPQKIPVDQHGSTILKNPIQSEIRSNKNAPFIKITTETFTPVMAKIAKTTEKKASLMGFKIQHNGKSKGLKIFSEKEEDSCCIGKYKEEIQESIFFPIRPKKMEEMALFSKGYDKNFIDVTYDEHILKLSWEIEYIFHEFYCIRNE